MAPFLVLNFYKFVPLADLPTLRLEHEAWARELKVKGSILLASEGINGALSGSAAALEEYARRLMREPRFSDLRLVYSHGRSRPFKRFKVKIKDYIVVFPGEHKVVGEEIASAPYMPTGRLYEHLQGAASGQDVVLVDTRNYYEVDYGTFAGAEHLGIKNFRDFPERFLERYADQKDKTFVMFCTGGIRCEKAAVFARKAGFKKTFQLDGGVLKYFQEHGGANWRGNLFVFDDRWSITPELTQAEDGPHPDQISLCDSI